jgi:hypothetical protein
MSLSFLFLKLALHLLPDLIEPNNGALCDLDLNGLSRCNAHINEAERLWDAPGLDEEC